jgi:hypothetical protein
MNQKIQKLCFDKVFLLLSKIILFDTSQNNVTQPSITVLKEFYYQSFFKKMVYVTHSSMLEC